MLLFGHIGLAVGIFYLLNAKLKKDIDYRFLIAGSLLSDIIDKPLGNIILYNILNNGRLIGHTLLFALILTAIGIYRKKIIYVAAGVFTHLILDRLWADPRTLLWPLLGNFQYKNFQFTDLIGHFYADPFNYGGEIIGFAVLVYVAAKHHLYLKTEVRKFISTGRLNKPS